MSEPEEAWAADMLYGCEPCAAPPTKALEFERPEMHILATLPEEPTRLDTGEEPAVVVAQDVNAGARKTAVVLGAALLCAAVVITAALSNFGDHAPVTADSAVTAPALAAVAPPAPSVAPAGEDVAVRYTASADCPAGSTSAQALTDITSDSAWVCVRGSSGAAVDGQVLRVDFGSSYVLSAISVTPGWVAKTPVGKDEWLQHRVISRLQYIFDDTDRTIFTQDTGDVHGAVTTPLPHKVLASRVTVVILQTARPLGSPDPTSEVGGPIPPDFGDSLLGVDGAPPLPDATAGGAADPLGEQRSDPVDATFAASSLTFFGHEPN